MPSIMKLVAAALAVAPLAAAQTYSDCNPTKKTCPANPGSTESDLQFDFTQPSGLDKWTTTAGKVNTGSNGAEFTINKKGDAPTIQTDFYFFYGEISVEMKTAPGQGIVSSIVLESDDLDEVDWVRDFPNNNETTANKIKRRALVATTAQLRPTTLARVTPLLTTVTLGPQLPLLGMFSTSTPSTGPRSPSSGPLTATSSALSTMPMLRAALASPRPP